jgi:hypothetical protein
VLDIDQNGEHTFFNTKHLRLDTKIDYDKPNGLLTLHRTTLGIEKASFVVEGTIQTTDSLNTNIRFSGNKPSLSTFAAFAPPTLAEALETYDNNGAISFAGTVQGHLLGAQMPAFRVDFACDNAKVINTNVNKRVESIYFSGFVTNGTGRSLKTSEFRLMNIRAKPEVGVFRGNIVVRNFEDPYVNVNVNADLDLEFLAAFSGIENLQRLKGQIALDMNFNELIDLDNPDKTLLRLKEGIDSELTIRNLSVAVPDYPHPISNINGHATMKQGFITMDNLSFTIADSDVRLTGSISDFPALFHAAPKPVELTLNATASRITLAQLLAHDSLLARRFDEEIRDFAVNLAFQAQASDLRTFTHLPRGEFSLRNMNAQLKHYPHRLHDIRADVMIGENSLTVKDISAFIDGSDVHLTASVDNIAKWFEPVKRGTSTLTVDVRSNRLAFNDIFSYAGRNYVPEQYRAEEIRGLAGKFALTMEYDSLFRACDVRVERFAGKFALHNFQLNSLRGALRYADGRVQMDDCSARVGKSDVTLRGAFPFTLTPPAVRSTPEATASIPTTLDLQATMLDIDELLTLKQTARALASAPSKTKTLTENAAYAPPLSNDKRSNDKRSNDKRSSDRRSNDSTPRASSFNIAALPFPDATVTARIGRLKFRSMLVDNLLLKLRTQSSRICTVDTMSFGMANGAFALTGSLDGTDSTALRCGVAAEVRRVDLQKLLLKMGNFGQNTLVSDNITGFATGSVAGTFTLHPDATPMLNKSEADIAVTIKQGELLNFAPFQAMAKFFNDKNLHRVRFDTLRNTLKLTNGVLNIPTMTINSSLGYMEITGKQDLQRSSKFAMDYVMGIPLRLVGKRALAMLFGKATQRDSSANDPQQHDSIYYRPATSNELLIKMRVVGIPGDFKITPVTH